MPFAPSVTSPITESVAQAPPPGPVNTSLSLLVSPNPVLVGTPATCGGKLVRTDTGGGVPSKAISIQTSPDGTTYTTVTQAVTDSTGAYSIGLVFNAVGTVFIRAVFAGDTSFNASSSSPVQLSIVLTPPPTQVTTTSSVRAPSPNPTVVGTSVSIGGWVVRNDTHTRIGAGFPAAFDASADGGVTWSQIATGLTNSNGDVFASWTPVSAGTYNLRMRFLGGTDTASNTTFLPSTSTNPEVETVTSGSVLIPTAVTFTTSPNPSSTGQSVAGTGHLTRTDTGAGISGGIIVEQSTDGVTWTQLTSAVADSAGNFSVNMTFTGAGSVQLRARFAGDTTFAPSTSLSVTQTVQATALPTTAITITSTPNPSAVGQTVTVSGHLSRTDTGAALSGKTVSVVEGTAVVATVVTDTSGNYSVPLTFNAAGTFSLQAQFTGDSSFQGSSSAILTQTVSTTQVATSTGLRAPTPNPASVGQAVTVSSFTVRLDTNLRVGAGFTVAFDSSTDGVNWTQGATAVTNTNGDATTTVAFAAAGTYFIRARFLGDATLAPSTSGSLTETVQAAGPVAAALTLTCSPNPAQVNTAVACTGTLTRTDTGGGVSGQPITLETSTDGVTYTTVPGATATTDTNGNYSVSVTFTAIGTYFIRSSCAGGTV